jgi:flavodoxin
MKKRVLFSLLIIIGLFVITGCGSNKVNPESEKKANDILNNQVENKADSKVLIVYFSRTGENYNVGNVEVGNTAIMASYMKEYLNADSFEIVPVNKYPDSYDECLSVATKEKNEDARPAIESKLDDISKYDTVFIGYPIWWGSIPQIVYTFMEEYDLSGKTIIPFNTHEGSGDAGTYNTIKNKLTKSNVNTNGLALQGKVARTDEGKEKTINWLKELGY